jgi:hypothetical protein
MPRTFEMLDSLIAQQTPIHVIGVGGGGSNLVFDIVKLGAPRVHVHDGDAVSEYNWRNQRYAPSDAGNRKVSALAASVARYCDGFAVVTHSTYVNAATQGLSGIVCMCVDTMSARRDIFTACIAQGNAVELVIDMRAGIDYVRVLSLDPRVEMHRDMWEHGWYPDDEVVADVADCGSPIAVGATTLQAAATSLQQLRLHDLRLRGVPVLFANDIRLPLTNALQNQYIVWE